MARKFLTPIDLATNELQNPRLQQLASDPGSPVEGQFWENTTTHEYKWFNGTDVITIGSGDASGTVTSVAVESANGFAGTVADDTTDAAITISTSVTGLLKGNGTAVSAASSGTDYAPATSGSAILKGNGSGGFSSASSGTDYAPATSGSSILKGNGSGGFSSASSGTDYAPATSGSSALKGNGSGGFGSAVLNDVGAATGDYSLNSHKITSLADPASAQDAATKNYVDATAQGLSGKYSAVAATTGSETFTVTSGSVTQISGTTLDGQSPSVNDYILIKDAPASSGTGSAGSTEPGNGLYQVTNATTNLTVSRATAMSGSSGPAGAYVFVEGGTAAKSNGYVVSTPSTSAAFTYGTNNIAWTQFSGAGEVTAGTGLSKSGNTLSLTTPVASSNGGAGTVSGILKANGSGTVSAATSGTDYAPATSGSSILKGNGSGGFSSASSGTDYAPATSGSAVLGGNGAGGFSAYGYAAAIGDGSSTSITVTHSLGSRDVIVQVYDASSYVGYECDVTRTSTSVVTLGFTTAPTSNSLRVVISRAA